SRGTERDPEPPPAVRQGRKARTVVSLIEIRGREIERPAIERSFDPFELPLAIRFIGRLAKALLSPPVPVLWRQRNKNLTLRVVCDICEPQLALPLRRAPLPYGNEA